MIVVGSGFIAGCTALSPAVLSPDISPGPPFDTSLVHLAADLAQEIPGAQMLAAPKGICGSGPAPVVRLVIPEQVLFATASDQPGPAAKVMLDAIVKQVRADAPDAVLTVLGHTDAVGSDAYNVDLSKRRAATVLRALVTRGLDPDRIGAVAIGKRQPIASNATPEGRARNRRVEFLISDCLAANLAVVAGVARDRAMLGPDEDTVGPVEVMRLDPIGANGLTSVATVSLNPAEGEAPVTSVARPSATVAKPAPSPQYQPRALSPGVQPNRLGPPVPY